MNQTAEAAEKSKLRVKLSNLEDSSLAYRGLSPMLRYLLGMMVASFTVIARTAWRGTLNDSPFVIFTASVFIIYWYCGFGPGLAATVFFLAVHIYLILGIQHFNQLNQIGHSGVTSVVAFSITSLLIGSVISARRSARRNLDYQARRTKAIMDTALDGIMIMDHQGRILEFNQSALDIFGYQKDQVAGREMLELITPPHSREEHRRRLADFLATGQGAILGRRLNIEAQRADGSNLAVELSINPISGGTKPVFAGFIRDITDRIVKENELNYQLMLNRSIIENAADALFLTDEKNFITFASPSVEQIFGWQPKEIIGRQLHETLHYELPDGTPLSQQDCPMRLAMVGREQLLDFEQTYIHKDGTLIDVVCSSNVIRHEGELVGSVQIVHDISERRHIQETNQRLAAIVESSDDAVFSKTLDGVVTSWNRGAERLYGYRAGEVIGKHVDILLPQDYPNDIVEILSRLRKGDRMSHYETLRRSKNGRLINVSLSVSPLKDSKGQITGASVIARDISEAKRLEALKDEFISVASHELKTPVTALKVTAQSLTRLIQRDGGHPNLAAGLGTIDRQTDKLAQLVRNILDVSRLETGQLPMRQKEANLSDLVSACLEQLRNILKDHVIEADITEPINVLIDADRIEQVLNNLVTNAARHSPEGSKISVEVHAQGDQAVVSVTDQGEGIPPDKQQHLFDRFTQAAPDHSQGLGLGLYISRQILNQHRGKINMQSRPGQGSRFWFTLPLAVSAKIESPAKLNRKG